MDGLTYFWEVWNIDFFKKNLFVFLIHQIHRSKNKWKFYLKDGVMSFEGKDHVFAKAVGDAEW